MDGINDDRKLYQKISNKKSNAKLEGIEFHLNKKDIIFLLKEAGIVSSQWEHKGFHLARYDDNGAYSIGNCRFVPCSINYAERKVSDKCRATSRINALSMNSDPDRVSKIKESLRKSNRWAEYMNRRKTNQLLNEKKKYLSSHPSYRGNRNSQYGTHWITNGTINKKIKQGDNLPEGFCIGRTIGRGW